MILAKTVKGFGMGKAGEGQMVTHQQKKLSDDDLKAIRDRFNIPVSDEEISRLPFKKPADDAPEMVYLRERRAALGGSLPVRRNVAPPLRFRRSRPSRRCSMAAMAARSPRPWPSCAC